MGLKLVAVVALAASAASSSAYAQVSMTRSVIGSGGGTSVGGSISVTGTVGEAVTDRSDDGGPLSVCSGYWCIQTPACGPADVASLGVVPGPDGALTVDDLVYFISCFFANNIGVVDIATVGGGLAPDGSVTVDDLVAYLQFFFSPC